MYKSAVISGFLYIPIASGNILLKNYGIPCISVTNM